MAKNKEPLNFPAVTDLMNELKAALGKNDSATIGSNTLSLLHGDGNYSAGDFRSKECVAALREADIVVINPPFSLFREFVKRLVDADKKFLIIGNYNAVPYKEISRLFMDNKIWLGYGFLSNVGFFISHYEDIATASQHRDGMIRVSGVTWFTNLEQIILALWVSRLLFLINIAPTSLKFSATVRCLRNQLSSTAN